MDSSATAAARALARGDALGALNLVALRDDPPALALRGIAMAQLGEMDRAKELLRRAARAFGANEPVAQARCLTAEAEIALASRELGGAEQAQALAAARATLLAHGDRVNALHAALIAVRRLLVLGRVAEARDALAHLELADAPAMLTVVAELLRTDVAVRLLRTKDARAAIERAEQALQHARIPSLAAEIEAARKALASPAARAVEGGAVRELRLDEVEALLASKAFVVDACRNRVVSERATVPLARRPVLFALARALAEAWPDDAPREALIAQAFGALRVNESHRVRLRVEIGRLRRALRPMAELVATPRGFVLKPKRAKRVVVLARPVEGAHGDVLALLADGESWSSSALALALGTSQRNVQRALVALEEAAKVRSFGRARAQRWTAPPVSGFTTTLLLPAPLPID